MLQPKKTKYRKAFKGRIHGAAKGGFSLNFGSYGLKTVEPERITARYRVNGLNRPSLTIDRRSGLIEIKGLPGFSGKCDVGDWGAGRKF